MHIPKNVSAMGLVYDNLNGYNLETTRRLTALYALLYDEIAISDSWLMTNGPFQQMLSTRDGVELVVQGIIRPLRRDSVQSYAEFYDQASGKTGKTPMHGLCATPEFVAKLDDPKINARTQTFVMKQVGENYKVMSEQVLSPQVLANFGISDDGNTLVQKRIQKAKIDQEAWTTNTFVKDILCKLLEETLVAQGKKDATLLMELARAPYSLNLPTVLGLGIVGPDDFRGDQILAALGGNVQTIGGFDVKKSLAEAAFKKSIDNLLIKWLLSDEILQDLTTEELVICRSPEERRTYLDKLHMFLNLPNKKNWEALIAEFTVYLGKAAEELFKYRANKNSNIEDPSDGQIVLEGSTSIRLKRSGKTVVLTGASSPTKKPAEDLVVTVNEAALSIIGKTLSLPTAIDRQE